MADRLVSKDCIELSNNASSSLNSNETQMFLQGITLEEDALDKEVKRVLIQIETMKHNLLQEKYANAMLSVDCDYLRSFKAHEDHDALEQALKEEKTVQDQLKKERAHIALERDRAILEAMRTANPKLYNLKKKLLGIQEQCQDKKFELESLEEERNRVSNQYTDLVSSLKGEETMKSKIHQLERIVEKKDAEIQDLKSTFSRLQTEVEDCDMDMQTKKDLAKLLDVHQQLNANLTQARKDTAALRNTLSQIEHSLANATQSPCTDNSEMIREEIRRLERTITERTKEIELKEKKRKELVVAKAKAEEELKVCKATCKPKEQTKGILNSSPKMKQTVMINTPNSGLASYRVSLSPKQMEMSKSPGARSRKSRTTVASRSKRSKLTEEQQKALKTMVDVERSKAPAEVVNTLKTYGSGDLSLTAKVIQLNRCMQTKTS